MRWVAALVMVAGCTAADRELEPEDLDARDLLGLSPAVTAAWDAEARAGARGVLEQAWAEEAAAPAMATQQVLAPAADRAAAVVGALRVVDAEREAAGRPPLVGAVASVGEAVRVAGARSVALGPEMPAERVALDPAGWSEAEIELVWRGEALLATLAREGGHPDGAALPVRPAARAPFGAVYAGAELGVLVNPVVLAALEPLEGEDVAAGAVIAGGGGGATERRAGAATEVARPGGGGLRANAGVGGNPYSFFGSVEECAAYQRLRCEDCIAAGACETTSRDADSGVAECEALLADDGRGTFLYCANLSLAIATVAECAEDGCEVDRDASNQLSELETNAPFVDDARCLGVLDECLSDIYGEPDQDFPGPGGPDGGALPEPPPPRNTEVSCGEADCDFSPQCDSSCSAGSCGEVFSCDADCSSEGTGSASSDGDDGCGDGSGGGCDCDGSGGGGCNDGCGDEGGGGGSDSGCGGGDGGGGGGGDSGGGCGGDGGDSGGGCGGDGGGCGGGGGGGCGGGSNDSGGCGGGGEGGGGCVVAGGGARAQAPRMTRGSCPRRSSVPALLALMWAFLPLFYLERCRRSARRAAGGQP